MCTVTFFPNNDQSWLLSTNRDEMRSRERAIPPAVFRAGTCDYLAPLDSKAGGTWVALNSAGLGLTILNNYQGVNPLLNHRKEATSRGLIIPQMIDLITVEQVNKRMQELEVTDYNPFRLLAIQSNPVKIMEWSWDGEHYQSKTLPVKPHIWVSTGKDYEGVWKNRKTVFDDFLKVHPHPGVDAVKKLHASRHPEAGAYAIAMELDMVATVSNTIMVSANSNQRMYYHDGTPEESGIWVPIELSTTNTKVRK